MRPFVKWDSSSGFAKMLDIAGGNSMHGGNSGPIYIECLGMIQEFLVRA